MKCYNCKKDITKHPECKGLLNPLRLFLQDGSMAGAQARILVKKYNANVRLCGNCFWTFRKSYFNCRACGMFLHHLTKHTLEDCKNYLKKKEVKK